MRSRPFVWPCRPILRPHQTDKILPQLHDSTKWRQKQFTLCMHQRSLVILPHSASSSASWPVWRDLVA
jgi:hypothetical protein